MCGEVSGEEYGRGEENEVGVVGADVARVGGAGEGEVWRGKQGEAGVGGHG